MKYSVVAAILVLALAWSQPASSQDQSMKQDTKKAMSHGDMDHGMKKSDAMSKTDMGPLKNFSCGDPCDYSISSRDEKEVTTAAIAHVKKHHHMDLTEQQIKEKITEMKDTGDKK